MTWAQTPSIKAIKKSNIAIHWSCEVD